ncbi:MAG: glycosyltransferase, partial [Muribaculaceae bacterium]|nr:glycosyltransferase [Muribaculaceae bacterium]
RKAYEGCDIVVSSSEFETLPGTLIEGQAYGCVPVAFDHGGQGDIIDHEQTGWLADWNDNPSERARLLAEGIIWAYRNAGHAELISRMRDSVVKKFSAIEVARRISAFAFRN